MNDAVAGSVPSPSVDGLPERPAAAGAGARQTWMDAIRGTAILLMLLLHATMIPAVVGGMEPVPWLVAITDATAPFRMPVLMFLSGMLLDRALAKPAKRYLSGKFRVLLWSYVVWAVVYFMVMGRPGELFRPWTWVQTLYLWFLAFLLAYYVLALVLRRIPAIVVAVAALVPHVVLVGAERGFLARFFLYMTVFFAGAAFTRFLAARPGILEPRRRDGHLLVGLPLLVVGVVAIRSGGALPHPAGAVVGAVAAVAVAMGLVLVVQALVPRPRGPLVRVGQQSLVYYCVHYPVMVLVVRLGERLSWDVVVVSLVSLVAAVVVCAVIAEGRDRVPVLDALFRAPAPPRRRRPVTH